MQEPNYAHIKCFGCLFFRAAANAACKQKIIYTEATPTICQLSATSPTFIPTPFSLHAACSRVDFGNKVSDKLFGLAKGHGA